MPFPQFIFSSSDQLSSSAPSKDTQAAPVGAGVAQISGDQYFYHDHFIKWIQETQKKLPNATPQLRREAYLADPLLKGTIYPYLKNVLLQGFTIQTKDNKLYSEAIEEIKDYLESLELMQVFREDFLNFAILDGHSYRRMDPDLQGNILRLEKIEPSSVTVYTDPWDSSIVAFHQKAMVKTSWSSSGTTQQVDSWFIPFGKDILDINATYIDRRESGNDQRVFDLFNKYKTEYSITDTANLRIAAAERIVAMHNSERIETENGDSAPIDSVLLAIWLKRLLLSNAPHLIYIVINPFLHAKSGIIKEVKDAMGNTTIVSSTPPKPAAALQAANPDAYNAMLQNFNNWIESIKEAQKKVMENVKNGGVFTSGPDYDLKPIESARNITYQFIKGLIDQLNEEIGLAFGFPMSLVLATGTELASSRNILQIFNSVHAGERTEYEAVANRLIKKAFEDRSWQGEGGSYSFEDIKAHFVLDTPDTKDLLQEAQALKTKADTLVQVKAVGGSRSDVQALGDEYGFGLLGLDNYGAAIEPQTATQVNAILKACLVSVMEERGLISASPTAPSGFKNKVITEKLQEAYITARETVDELFEEH